MKRLAVAAIAIFSLTTSIAETGWVEIASDDDSTWHIKSGSLEFRKTKGGVNIASVIGRISNNKTSQVALRKWYVSAVDCKNKMGKVVTLDISGDYKFENDFVEGAGTIASSMAEAICGAAEYRIKEADSKSL
jgi:hydroxyethylthiazole kinase-like sugar kinase family protein